MRRLISEAVVILLGMCSLGLAQHTALITIEPGVNNEMNVIIDPQMHRDYGVTYPLTYEFSIPEGVSGLRAYTRHARASEWAQILEKTSDDFFNATEVVRFEYALEKAFLSVGFANSSDTIYVKMTDNAGQSIPVTFNRICKYYDDRDAVVSCSADDYADWNLGNFLKTIGNFRSKHLWLSIAVNTAACNQRSFDSLQVALDRGYMEASAHSRSHPMGPFTEPDSEITGCKMDLINRLDIPPLFRSGHHEYVYTWVAPYGYDDQLIDSLLGQNHFLANRLYYSDERPSDFPDWDEQHGLYSPFGVTREVGPVRAGFIGTGDSTDLNNAFDDVVTRGGIYYLMCHPSIVEWDKAYTWSHLNHISDRKDIWYVSLGHLFVYHFAQDNSMLIPTAVADNKPTAPVDYSLSQNYPNPFNPVTTIQFSIGNPQFTMLAVYDLLGREVAVLVNEKKPSGSYEVTFNASGLASSVYIYRLTAGDFTQTRRMILVR